MVATVSYTTLTAAPDSADGYSLCSDNYHGTGCNCQFRHRRRYAWVISFTGYRNRIEKLAKDVQKIMAYKPWIEQNLTLHRQKIDIPGNAIYIGEFRQFDFRRQCETGLGIRNFRKSA